MGYDMRWVTTSDLDPQPLKQAKESFEEACKYRDQFPRGSSEAVAAQKAVNIAYKELQRADVSYFRLNILGMVICCEYMADYGMLYESKGPDSHKWPDYPEEAADGSVEMLEYELAVEKLVSRPGGEMPGIPSHKFSSNDGWLVLPLECETAVEAWEKAGSPEPTEWFKDWVEFLRQAAVHGGFRVY